MWIQDFSSKLSCCVTYRVGFRRVACFISIDSSSTSAKKREHWNSILKALPEKQRKKALRFPLLLVWQIISCPRKGRKKSLKDSSSYIGIKQTPHPRPKKNPNKPKKPQPNKKLRNPCTLCFPVGSYFPYSDSWKSLEFFRFLCLFVWLIGCFGLVGEGCCCCLFGCGFGWLVCGFGFGLRVFFCGFGWMVDWLVLICFGFKFRKH